MLHVVDAAVEIVEVKEMTVSEYIIYYSKIYNVDQSLALNVACAESCNTNTDGTTSFVVTAKNPNSSASGVYQFIKSTWTYMCTGDVMNAEDNVKCGVKVLASKNGINHWAASKYQGYGGGWTRLPYDTHEVVN